MRVLVFVINQLEQLESRHSAGQEAMPLAIDEFPAAEREGERIVVSLNEIHVTVNYARAVCVVAKNKGGCICICSLVKASLLLQLPLATGPPPGPGTTLLATLSLSLSDSCC